MSLPWWTLFCQVSYSCKFQLYKWLLGSRLTFIHRPIFKISSSTTVYYLSICLSTFLSIYYYLLSIYPLSIYSGPREFLPFVHSTFLGTKKTFLDGNVYNRTKLDTNGGICIVFYTINISWCSICYHLFVFIVNLYDLMVLLYQDWIL